VRTRYVSDELFEPELHPAPEGTVPPAVQLRAEHSAVTHTAAAAVQQVEFGVKVRLHHGLGTGKGNMCHESRD